MDIMDRLRRLTSYLLLFVFGVVGLYVAYVEISRDDVEYTMDGQVDWKKDKNIPKEAVEHFAWAQEAVKGSRLHGAIAEYNKAIKIAPN